jgi:GrpB-like predicted nucleotidyltransferase (UPF0157 family)
MWSLLMLRDWVPSISRSCDGERVATHPLWLPYSSTANAGRQAGRIAHRQVRPGPLQVYRREWAAEYDALRLLIEDAIPDQALAISHVGSTAVAGLLAKPVIDVDLTVPDAAYEPAYVPRLAVVGFRLIFRDDIGGDAHRQLTFGTPNANLHVWSPGAIEPQRHAMFITWLRTHPRDRDRYAAAKRAATDGVGTMQYNDSKSAVVYDIHERAFLADSSHPHDPQPHPTGNIHR